MTLQRSLFAECQHERTTIVPEKRGPHHAKKICAVCHRFIEWVPKPETVEQQRRNAITLTELAKIDHLTEWERAFVRDLVTHKHISPKQQKHLDLLRDKYLQKGGLPSDGIHGEAVLRDRDLSNQL